ncbi:MAG: hypothetical protein Q4A67_01970 [Aerococcus sp.]|nr:hypothetical protein [Aerococcus sp.]
MELRRKKNWGNYLDGMRSLVFPSVLSIFPKKPLRRHFYTSNDQERLRKDYKKSTEGIRDEVTKFERR